jgi:hypothetical protein
MVLRPLVEDLIMSELDRDRTRLDGALGVKIWTGQGIFAHNQVKIGALAG